MNKFITKRTPVAKPKPKDSGSKENEKTQEVEVVEEKSVMEILHNAIKTDDAEHTYKVLSKNRPFDSNMNKTMTKMEFGPTFNNPESEFLLLSVDNAVVDAFYEGQSVTIRGENGDDAVLCTNEATYPMKIVESATTMLLLHNMLEAPKTPKESKPNFEVKMIDGRCYATGELCPPSDILNISRLKDLLHETELPWDWMDKEEQSFGHTMDELLQSVQMSEREIEIAMKDLPVVQFDTGKYTYLSHKFRGEMYGHLVEFIDDDTKENVTMDKISSLGLRAALPENVPDEVIEWFMSTRCEKNMDEDSHHIIEECLVRDLIVIVLYGAQKMEYNKFREVINKILPYNVFVKPEHFEGIADICDAPFGKTITYLAPEDLPDTIFDRMTHLFNHRKLWTMDQLRPFFTDLFKSKVSFDKYLVQKCDYTLSETNEIWYCGIKH